MQGFVIRKGREADVEMLLKVEAHAARLLLDYGGHDLLAMHALSREDLMHGARAGILPVAEIEGAIVGFALAGEIDGHAHLFEMDVDPACGRCGIGSALLEAVCVEAAARRHRCITLITLREVPWNAPFYARRRFVEILEHEWGQELASLVERERLLGVPVEARVVMGRPLSCSRQDKED